MCDNCLPENLIDNNIHNIVAGPFSSEQECCDNCAANINENI
jgi:hypothetical protein